MPTPTPLNLRSLFLIWLGVLPKVSGTPPGAWRTQSTGIYWLGMVLWALCTGLFAWTATVSFDACTRAGKPLSLVAAQLLGPLLAAPDFACDATKTTLALGIDYALIGAYCLVLAYPVTWALERRQRSSMDTGHALDRLTAKVHWFMWAFPLFDLLEDALTAAALVPQLHFWPAWLVAAASVGKFSCLGVLSWVLLRGWLRR